jgi:hypothetical protein
MRHVLWGYLGLSPEADEQCASTSSRYLAGVATKFVVERDRRKRDPKKPAVETDALWLTLGGSGAGPSPCGFGMWATFFWVRFFGGLLRVANR